MIFLPGNVPALKNNKVKTSKGIFSSPAVTEYIHTFGITKYSSSKKTVELYKTKKKLPKKLFKEYFKDLKIKENEPILLGFHFVRKTMHRFDFGNAIELIADLLTAHNIIEDDNANFFLPFPLMIDGNWYSYDKDKPGVYIKQIKKINYEYEDNAKILSGSSLS